MTHHVCFIYVYSLDRTLSWVYTVSSYLLVRKVSLGDGHLLVVVVELLGGGGGQVVLGPVPVPTTIRVIQSSMSSKIEILCFYHEMLWIFDKKQKTILWQNGFQFTQNFMNIFKANNVILTYTFKLLNTNKSFSEKTAKIKILPSFYAAGNRCKRTCKGSIFFFPSFLSLPIFFFALHHRFDVHVRDVGWLVLRGCVTLLAT